MPCRLRDNYEHSYKFPLIPHNLKICSMANETNNVQNPRVENFYHLLDCDFHIPAFQRGYRWEKKQVIDLLNDLMEFVDQTKQGGGAPFYCLQPIVVVKRKEGARSYDLLDGQQRLTTLYLLLAYLEETRKGYSNNQALYGLHFDTRTSEDDYLKEKLFKADNNGEQDNIDFFFMREAYKTIERWFEGEEVENDGKKERKGCHNYDKIDILHCIVNEEKKEDSQKHDLRVIWYEAEAQDVEGAIDVFRRLNYGKIELTEAELIKALLLQTDRYEDEKDPMRQWTFKAAAEWDAMEKSLQCPQFWHVLGAPQYGGGSHIALLLDLVVKHLIVKADPTTYKNFSAKDEKYRYFVINKYLEKAENFADSVKKLWSYVQDAFAILNNWYGNRNLYHKIGLLAYFASDGKKLLHDLFLLYKEKDKREFERELDKKIGEAVRLGENKENNNPLTLADLRYGDHDKEIRHILTLHNVYYFLTHEQDGARFDFAQFRLRNATSLEHIHPQNLRDENIKYDDFCKWLDEKEKYLKLMEADSSSSEKLTQAREAVGNLKPYITDKEEEKKKKKEKFEENKQTCLKEIERVDAVFDELAGMDEDIMHSLRNLALVTQQTNSTLGNRLLDEKRDQLRRRAEQGDYIPLATQLAFAKAFTEPPVGNMKFWQKPDREAYFASIKEAYKHFTK